MEGLRLLAGTILKHNYKMGMTLINKKRTKSTLGWVYKEVKMTENSHEHEWTYVYNGSKKPTVRGCDICRTMDWKYKKTKDGIVTNFQWDRQYEESLKTLGFQVSP